MMMMAMAKMKIMVMEMQISSLSSMFGKHYNDVYDDGKNENDDMVMQISRWSSISTARYYPATCLATIMMMLMAMAMTTLMMMAKMKMMIMVLQISITNNLFDDDYLDDDGDTNDNVDEDGKNENDDYGYANRQFVKHV